MNQDDASGGYDHTGNKPDVLNLDMDSLVLCASKLNVKDLANMAITCKRFRDAAYADPVWNLKWQNWLPNQKYNGAFHFYGGREAYVNRYIQCQQLRFSDPINWDVVFSAGAINHILFEDNKLYIAQGANLSILELGTSFLPAEVKSLSRDHTGGITSMRLFPAEGLGQSRNNVGGAGTFLTTASFDHTLRIWHKGRSIRTLRGHTGSVTSIADKLLGNDALSILASGSMDCTVRLWKISSGSYRGRSPLQATLHGHEQCVRELAVAGHNSSILISASRDSKLRVWDASAGGKGLCVGLARGPGAPIGIKCVGALCYIGGGSAITAIDLRTLKNVATVAVHEPEILTFSLSPDGSVICTGGIDRRARLWDIRKVDSSEPLFELGTHSGPVHFTYVDSYKVVTGGRQDTCVYVWDRNAGELLNALNDADAGGLHVSAMAVNGARVALGTGEPLPGVLSYWDYSNSTTIMQEPKVQVEGSKFWETTLKFEDPDVEWHS